MPAATAGPRAWSTPADVLGLLRKRWQSGVLLSAFAAGQDWEPLGAIAIGHPAQPSGPRGPVPIDDLLIER